MSEELEIRIPNANPDDPNIPLGLFIHELQAVLEALKKTEAAMLGPRWGSSYAAIRPGLTGPGLAPLLAPTPRIG